jgi:hypothetical protein
MVVSAAAPLSARLDAMTILVYAAQPHRAGRYEPAFERFTEVFRRSNDVRFKSGAIGAIIETADEGEETRALAFLRPIASRLDPEFPTLQSQAINLAAQLNTAESVGFLRQLDQSGSVTDERSRRELRTIAANGYRVPRRRR